MGLIKAKMLALLHDPAYKVWVITAAFRVGDSRAGRVLARREESERVAGDGVDECRGLVRLVPWARRAHEAEAMAIAYNVLSSIVGPNEIRSLWSTVARADELASAFDRWLLPEEASEGAVKAPEAIVNPFNPAYRYPLRGAPPVRSVCSFVKRLREAVEDAYRHGEASLAYHVLYALLEPLWYSIVGDYVSPADTRVPTHTVFDHLYATASAVNWVADGRVCGILAFLDLASVQEWLRASRRLSDMWAASWLASALAWATVRGLVETYGPDILVLPTARLNPFYLLWLANELRERGASRALQELHGVLEETRLAGTVIRVEERGGKRYYIPVYPVMPVTVTLMLPCSIDDPEEVLVDSYQSYWARIVEELEGWFGSEMVGKLLKLVEREPPLPIRVAHVGVNAESADFKGFVEKAAGGFSFLRSKPERLLYVYALHKLLEKARKLSMASAIAGVGYSAKLTEEAWKARRRYRECTMCSRRPALPEESLDPLRERGVVDEHEHLCPYCLVKRLVGRGLLPASLGLIHGSLASLAQVRLPSLTVNVVASLDAVIRVCGLAGLPLTEPTVENLRSCLDKLREVYRDVSVEGCPKPDSIEDVFELYFRTPGCAVKLLLEVVRKLSGRDVKVKDVEASLRLSSRYYAIVYADADGVGDAIFGFIGLAGEDTEGYWRMVRDAVADGKAREALDPSMLASAVSSIAKALDGGRRERVPVTIPTPAYHSALSMALMGSALTDTAIVRALGGLLVYAGGDDMIAIAPARSLEVATSVAGKGRRIDVYGTVYSATVKPHSGHPPLLAASSITWADIVASTRRSFWALDLTPPGFHRLGKVVVAAPAGLGRTYAVVLAHYREPLLLRVADVRRLEKLVKDATKPYKDSVAVLYGRGTLVLSEAGYLRNTKPSSYLSLTPSDARSIVAYSVASLAALTLTVLAQRSGLREPAEGLLKRLNLKPAFTVSVVSDMEGELGTVESLLKVSENVSMVKLLLERIAERNLTEEGKAADAENMVETVLQAADFWSKGIGDGLAGFLRAWRYALSASR